jgi:TetR/AcrR family fatty acid metabolism transcriptional regulator
MGMKQNGYRSFSKERLYQEREEAILQVAGDVLMEKGYYGMSMDEIADRVGIGKPTLYRHFASKGELLCKLVMRDLPTLCHALEAIRTDQQTSVQRKLEATLQTIYQHSDGTCLLLLFSGNIEIPQALPEKRIEVEEVHKDIVKHIRYLLEEGKARGEFDTSLPIPLMLSFFFSLLTPGSYQSLIVEECTPVEDLIASLMRLYAPR